MTKSGFRPKGKVEFFITKGSPAINQVNGDIDFSNCEIIDSFTKMNIVVSDGKNKIIQSFLSGNIKKICRMAIGDRGTIPSDPTVPKTPTEDRTTLYNEVFRSDIDSTIATTTDTVHEIKFIKTFSAASIPISSFSNQSSPAVNEVGLIMADLISGAPLPRPDISAPASPDADESLFSIRCFKSVPFESANDISITIRYTIFIE